MASNQKKRCDGPSLAAVPTQLEPTTKRIWVRTRSRRPSGFLSATLWSSTLRSAFSNPVVTARRRIFGSAVRFTNVQRSTIGWQDCLQTLSSPIVDLTLPFGGRFFWRRHIAKFAVANFSAGVGDVTADSQSHGTKQNYGDHKRHRKFGPFHRQADGDRA